MRLWAFIALAFPLIVFSDTNLAQPDISLNRLMDGNNRYANDASIDIASIAPYIQSAVDERKNLPGDHLVNAIKANVNNGIKKLKKNRMIASLVKSKKLKIIGAYYELNSGKIELLAP